MADVSVTAASVLRTASTSVVMGIAGATVTAGQPVYQDATDGLKLKPTDADVLASSQSVGIALHGASAGQPLQYAVSGSLTFNAGFTVGQVYVCSVNAGGIAPYADLATGDFVTVLGVATTTSNLKMGIVYSGIAKP
jgi:hypothetical protein